MLRGPCQPPPRFAGGRRSPPRCSTRCLRCCSSHPRSSRAGRWRRPTCCGRSRRGPRTAPTACASSARTGRWPTRSRSSSRSWPTRATRLPDVPLWNPYIEGGRPFNANMQSAIFSPFSWPAYVLPFWWSLGLIGALKLWVPAFGTFLLARAARPVAWARRCWPGVVAGFGLFHVVWLAWPLSSVWAWLPWVLLRDRPRGAPAGRACRSPALALVVALQYFGGHPETSFHVLAVALLFALLRGPRARRRGSSAAVAAGTALAAIVLIPFLELLAHSSDLANRAGREPRAHAAALRPRARAAGLLGPPDAARVAAVHRHAGVLRGRAAADAGRAWRCCRPTRERVAIAAAGAVALAIVLGVQPFFFVANHVPGFAQAHNTRLAIVTLLCLALLAGWGLDTAAPAVARALRGRRRRRCRSSRGSYAPVRIPRGEALKVAWGFATPRDVDVLPLASCSSGSRLRRSRVALLWQQTALARAGRDRPDRARPRPGGHGAEPGDPGVARGDAAHGGDGGDRRASASSPSAAPTPGSRR